MKVRLTITESDCRSGYFKTGEEFIVEDLCPPLCHELWNVIYPYGRKLLAKALELNQPNGMMLLVDVDNGPAIRLYESMGFAKVHGQNNRTAHWTVPEQ